jgi:hypothetical protein
VPYCPEQVGLHLGVGIELSRGGDEVGAAVLAPGIVLVDRRQRLHLDVVGLHVTDQADIIHRCMRGGAEHIIVFRLLEDARRAAIHQHQHLLQLFGDRRHREAIAGADIAEHDVDVFALIEVAQFLHLLGGAAVLVDHDRLDLHAAEADLVVGRRRRAFVQLIDDELPAIARGHAKAFRGGTGQERDDAELESISRAGGQGERDRSCDDDGEASGRAADVPKLSHGFPPL